MPARPLLILSGLKSILGERAALGPKATIVALLPAVDARPYL